MIKFGDINIIGVFFGDIPITSAFKGEDLVYKTGGSKDAVVLKAVNPDFIQLNTNNMADRIDWGDGTIDTAVPEYPSHTYSDTSKEYIIQIFYKPENIFNYLEFDGSGTAAITEILQYGNKSIDIRGSSPKLTYIGSPYIRRCWGPFVGTWAVMTFGDFSNCTEFYPYLQQYNEIHFEDGFSVKKDCKIQPEFRDATKLTGFANFANGEDRWFYANVFGPNLTQIERIALPQNKEYTDVHYFKDSTELAFVNITNLGQYRKADNEDYIYNFSHLSKWGDDSIIAGARQSLVDSLVNNSFDVTKYSTNTTINLSTQVLNRLTDEEMQVIWDKGYLTPGREAIPPEPSYNENELVMLIDINKMNGREVKLPFTSGRGYDFKVDWGDGTARYYSTDYPTHTYSTSHQYYYIKVEVKYVEDITNKDYYGDKVDMSYLIKVINWGISSNRFDESYWTGTNLTYINPNITLEFWSYTSEAEAKFTLKTKSTKFDIKGLTMNVGHLSLYTNSEKITKWGRGNKVGRYNAIDKLFPYDSNNPKLKVIETLDCTTKDNQSFALASWLGSGCGKSLECIRNVTMNDTAYEFLIYPDEPMTNLRYAEFHNIGAGNNLNFKNWVAWGENTPEYPNARESLVKTLVTNTIDRKARGISGTCWIHLPASVIARLTEEEKAAIKAKGYAIQQA